jgi:hypothetical protein
MTQPKHWQRIARGFAYFALTMGIAYAIVVLGVAIGTSGLQHKTIMGVYAGFVLGCWIVQNSKKQEYDLPAKKLIVIFGVSIFIGVIGAWLDYCLNSKSE